MCPEGQATALPIVRCCRVPGQPPGSRVRVRGGQVSSLEPPLPHPAARPGREAAGAEPWGWHWPGRRRRKRRRKAGGAAADAAPAAPGLAAPLGRTMSGPGGAAASGTPPAGSGDTPAGNGDTPALPRDYELAGKVMLLGDSGVGKTCFLLQFKDGAFLSGTFIATVGIDFRNKVVAVDGVKVKLQIWDTAGQERFRSVTHAYYRDAQAPSSLPALLLLYDITSKMSFDNIRAWLTEIHEYAQKDVVIMLLGNKADVSSERAVRTEDGASLAREYGVPFMETSAKTGMNVELAFLAVAN
ncbi:ras-related protein Rab-37 isoform X3 [Columba livia]|uniref:ras-related protein Rab-37 isoform X3 n=1 Tax=Columba livia TaxID=8932 RepID=UPI0031B9CA67